MHLFGTIPFPRASSRASNDSTSHTAQTSTVVSIESLFAEGQGTSEGLGPRSKSSSIPVQASKRRVAEHATFDSPLWSAIRDSEGRYLSPIDVNDLRIAIVSEDLPLNEQRRDLGGSLLDKSRRDIAFSPLPHYVHLHCSAEEAVKAYLDSLSTQQEEEDMNVFREVEVLALDGYSFATNYAFGQFMQYFPKLRAISLGDMTLCLKDDGSFPLSLASIIDVVLVKCTFPDIATLVETVSIFPGAKRLFLSDITFPIASHQSATRPAFRGTKFVSALESIMVWADSSYYSSPVACDSFHILIEAILSEDSPFRKDKLCTLDIQLAMWAHSHFREPQTGETRPMLLDFNQTKANRLTQLRHLRLHGNFVLSGLCFENFSNIEDLHFGFNNAFEEQALSIRRLANEICAGHLDPLKDLHVTVHGSVKSRRANSIFRKAYYALESALLREGCTTRLHVKTFPSLIRLYVGKFFLGMQVYAPERIEWGTVRPVHG